MKLNSADQTKVKDWIQAKCGNLRCVCCGHGQWQILDISTLSIGFDTHTTRFHYHDGLPQVTLACGNCAHLVAFSPALMGLKPDEPSKG